MALIDELRQLGRHISPSFHVPAADALNVLAALIAYAEHGPPVLKAAGEGAQAVADFFHEVEVGKAKDAGAAEPVKGQPVTTTPQAPVYPGAAPAGGGVNAAEVAALVIRQLQEAGITLAAQNRPTEAVVTESAVEPTADEPVEPAVEPVEPAPEPQPNVFGG